MRSASFFSICLLFSIFTRANNVALSNVSVINNATNTGKIIQFDLTWDNSWRTASTGNWDGVWVFFKFKDNDGKWYPLRFTGTDNTMPPGTTYDMGNNGGLIGIGMFIYRSNLGSGTAIANAIKAGIQNYPGTFDIRGYAIEMVYIPQGSFYVGDGSGQSGCYQNGTSGNPYQVTGNGNVTTIGTGTNNLNDTLSVTNFTGTIPGFPTGYSPFWMMKYELSQGAYRDFLNTLTYAQQVHRFWASAQPNAVAGTNLNGGSSRQGIEIVTPGSSSGNGTPAVVGCDYDNDNIYNETTDGEWIAATFLNWSDIAAYLDWAGLRPMTDLEFEKACRGPLTAVENEYAWGSPDITTVIYTLANPGQANESITNASSFLGNAITNSTFTYSNPVRGGIFGTASSTRISSGAGYYGVMELSGNLIEYCVNTCTAAGRSFNGKQGDGILTSLGYANENYWPGINGSINQNVSSGLYDGGAGVRATTGTLERGSTWYPGGGKVSSRVTIAPVLLDNTLKYNIIGIRGVRDAN